MCQCCLTPDARNQYQAPKNAQKTAAESRNSFVFKVLVVIYTLHQPGTGRRFTRYQRYN